MRALEQPDEGDPVQAGGWLQVARIAVLQATRTAVVAETASWHVRPSPSAILAVGDWALAQERLSATTRLEFAATVCRLAPGGAPFAFDAPRPAPASAEEAQALARFEVWFQANRPAWEREAARERRRWERVARELGVVLGGGAR